VFPALTLLALAVTAFLGIYALNTFMLFQVEKNMSNHSFDLGQNLARAAENRISYLLE
jgi:hypothetical protein